jgi:hypothetical protein
MPLRPCATVGCPKLVVRGHCRPHQRARDAAKNARVERRVYDDPRWEDARKRAIARAGGRCQGIVRGRRCPTRTGLHGHHFYEGGVQAMLRQGLNPFSIRWIVVLCGACHGREEARIRASRR